MNEALKQAQADYLKDVDRVIGIYQVKTPKMMLHYLKKAGDRWQLKRMKIKAYYAERTE